MVLPMAGLRENDLDVFELAMNDGSVFTRRYFAGFAFQEWQRLLHHAQQANDTIIGGVGSGKTTGAGISAATWAAVLPYFNFMDVAPTSWQASLMFDSVLQFAEAGDYAEKFITRVTRKPYPLIELYNKSTLRFMTAQDDISRLRGWEGDWMHGDEFGFIPSLARTLSIMRTRLRGKTPGRYPRARLGRLSVTTTATDNPDLWDRFDKMWESPAEYLSFTVRTDDNPHLTTRDIALMIEDIPEEIRVVEMDGQRPMGRGEYFPLHVVMSNEDAALNDMVHRAVRDKTRGCVYEESPRLGLMRYQKPHVPWHEYLIVGDPGTGNPPHRNAGCIGVFDITGFPDEFESRIELVAYAWVYGGGRYDNFVTQFKTWWEYYRCGLNTVVESTGPQKGFGDYAFTLGLQGPRMPVEEMDLSGQKKGEALQATIQLFQRGLLRIPFIRSMRTQLTGYTLPDKKIPQDIVSMLMCMGRWIKQWRLFGEDPGALPDEYTDEWPEDNEGSRRPIARNPNRVAGRPKGVR
jgi:hypothetical protein